MNILLIISTIALWIVVLLNLALTFALIRRLNALAAPPIIDALKVGQPAPDFTAETVNGETVRLSDYAGHEVAFVFVSPTCAPCRLELPKIEGLRAKAKVAGVQLVVVSDAEIPETQAMVNEFNLTLPVLSAPRFSNEFVNAYKVNATPFYCVLDALGTVSATGLVDNSWKDYVKQWETDPAPSATRRSVISLAPNKGR